MKEENLEIISPHNLIQKSQDELEDECAHRNIKGSVCTDCGYCIDAVVFQSPTTTGSTYNPSIPMRYVVRNPVKINDESIRKILIPLGLECYMSTVRDFLNTTKFKCRLKKEDKVIVTIYHILRSNQFPISLADLLKFSSMSKWKLLRAHRDVFGFVSQSNEYLIGIFNRVKSFLDKNNHPSAGSFEIYSNMHEIHRNSDPKALCMAYFLENNLLSTLVIRDSDEYDLYQIENIRKNLRKSFRRQPHAM